MNRYEEILIEIIEDRDKLLSEITDLEDNTITLQNTIANQQQVIGNLKKELERVYAQLDSLPNTAKDGKEGRVEVVPFLSTVDSIIARNLKELDQGKKSLLTPNDIQQLLTCKILWQQSKG